MDSKEIRRLNLRKLMKEFGKPAKEFAEQVETNPAYISQIFSAKTKAEVGDELARKIERRMKKPRGWLDHLEHQDTQLDLEAAKALKDFQALPAGLRAHMARKLSELRAFADSLPNYVRQSLKPPNDPNEYRAWEREVEEDMYAKLHSTKKGIDQ